MTKQQRETGADVPQGVKTDPQSENVEETEQQWDAAAQGPEHDGAYLEQVTCLR